MTDTTDAAAWFEQVMLDARAAAAHDYALAEVSRRLWSLALNAQGDQGEPVGVDDLLESARRRGGEEGRAEVQALLSRYLDLTTEPEPLYPDNVEEPA